MKVDKKMVLAAFSMAQYCFETRGLNEYEKKLVREAFYSLPFDDFETKTNIACIYSELFNKVMS
ncbi:hypothetical protein [Paenibacillus chitinolyticus]|uniref:hypothetical protein n=1 Tax=Paenibacillus chitinolyticus TaxID=79263 RepID=UPI00366D1036